jgi:putative ABC transport system permease protein
LATVGRLEQVVSVSGSTQVLWTVRRNPYIPSEYTSPFPVTAVIGGLAQAVGAHVLFGRGLGPDDRLADAVLGYNAAQILGIGRQDVPSRLWVQDQWVVVTGVLAAVPSAPQLNFSVIVGYAFAQSERAVSGGFNTLYLRTQPGTESAVMKILPATVEPLSPKDVTVSQPSAAVAAEIDAKTALNTLFVALAAVALLVAGFGVGNTLTIAVVERRPEIGLRRALGATRSDIGAQFLAEGVLLALGGAVVGVVVGTVGVEAYAWHSGVSLVLPAAGIGLGAAAALFVGSAAGLYPAVKAARLPPSDALRMAV